MSLRTLRTPHGRLVAVHNGATLAYLTRQQRVMTAALELAHERRLFDPDVLEPLTPAEEQLAEALAALVEVPA